MSKSKISPNKLIDLIEIAGKSGVSRLDMAIDGSVSIDFFDRNNKTQEAEQVFSTVSEACDMELAEEIADEAADEEAREITEDLLLEAEVNNPELIGKWIREGRISEADNGELIIN